jgi:hypothetical protein
MSEAADQLENEMLVLLRRYTEESDLHIMEIIGVLEKVKRRITRAYHIEQEQDGGDDE